VCLFSFFFPCYIYNSFPENRVPQSRARGDDTALRGV
jgi:hypothetical protein